MRNCWYLKNKQRNPIYRLLLSFLLILTCATTLVAQNRAVAGSGSGVEFNGTNGYIDLENHQNVRPTSAITVELWVLVRSAETWDGLISNAQYNGTSNDPDYAGYHYSFNSNRWLFYVKTTGDPGWTTVGTNDNLIGDGWVHLAGVYNGSNAILYVNGAEVDRKSASGSISWVSNSPDNTWRMRLGTYYDRNETDTNYLDGALDEVRVWNVARTAQQIQDNMYNTMDSTSNGLLMYYRLDEGSGTTANDYTPINQQGTLSGGASFINSEAWKYRITNDTTPLVHFAGYDPDLGTITISPINSPSQGTFGSNNAAKTCIYTPAVYQTGIKTYSYEVRDADGADTFSMNVRVDPAAPDPFVSDHPDPLTVSVGQQATFSITAAGSGTLQYQWLWQKIGQPWQEDTGATSSTYTINSATLDLDSNFYQCRVSNGSGTKWSEPAMLTVLASSNVEITRQPITPRVIATGDSVLHSVVATGTGTLTYQWDKYSTAWAAISGATSSEYGINPVAKADAGAYRARVSNGTSYDTSITCSLYVRDTVRIVGHPQDKAIDVDSTATFTVTAVGDDLSYQWQIKKPGAGEVFQDTINATLAALTTSPATLAMSGYQYRCIVSGVVGTPDTSNSATLVVGQSIKPQIITEPDSLYLTARGGAVSMVVEAIGLAPLSFQWDKFNTSTWEAVSGATNDTFAIASVGDAQVGVYRVRVWNDSGQDTSIHARLALVDSVKITKDPNDTIIFPGSTYRFVVSANGTPPITYQWQKRPPGGQFSNILGATDSILIDTARATDDNMWFKCIASSGPFHDTSGVAELTLGKLPNFQSHPRDTAIIANSKVTLGVSVLGTPAPVLQWYFLRPGASTPSLIDSSFNSTYMVQDSAKSDSGYFYVVAKNTFGSVSSDTAMVHVLNPIKITRNLSPAIQTINGGAAEFLVLTEFGDGALSYQWYVNNTPISGANQNIYKIDKVDSTTHSNNEYHCVASNTFQGVLNSISTVVPLGNEKSVVCQLMVGDYYNPFKVWVERIDIHNTKQVRVKLWSNVNISDFPTTGTPLDKYADSLWIIYKTNSQPMHESTAAVALFSTDEVKKATDTLRKTIDVTELKPGGSLPFPHDSSYYFANSIKWRVPGSQDTILRPYTYEGNGVFMLDTTASPNRLLVSGTYVDKTDSATITIDSVGNLNQNDDSLVVVQFSKFNDFTIIYASDTFTVAQLVASGASHAYTMKGLGILPILKYTMHTRWHIVGKNTSVSAERKNTFPVGWDRPLWTGTFKADSLMGDTTVSPDRILCQWDGQTAADSLRIWWNTDTIPHTHEVNLPASQVHYVLPSSRVNDTIIGLTPDVTYHFGAQIYKDGFWSVVSPLSTDSAHTGMGGAACLNVITVDSCWFNGDSNTIVVRWIINNAVAPIVNGVPIEGATFKAGYTWQLGLLVDTLNPPTIMDTVVKDTNYTVIPVLKPRFDSTYTVGLWLGYFKGNNIGMASKPRPDSSICQVTLPSFTWENVTFFENTQLNNEVISVANGKIILREITNFENAETDIIKAYRRPDSLPLPSGLVLIDAIHFRFLRYNYQCRSFNLSMQYGNLPPGISKGDLGMYRDVNGTISVVYGFSVGDSTVSAEISREDLNLQSGSYPFLILADTIAPTVITDAYTEIVVSNQDARTEFTISDNIANVRCDFYCGAGNRDFTQHDSTFLTKTNGKYTGIIRYTQSNNPLSESFGARALLVVTDGIRSDTINVSRSIQTSNAENFSIIAREWMPIRTPMPLTDPTCATVFNTSFPGVPWEYDKTKYRLFRYLDPVADTNGWMEYGDETKDYFTFEPGKLIWYKTSENKALDFGSGHTTSLKQPYEIKLKGSSFTDFCVPFKFAVLLQDVLTSTGPESAHLDFYHWVKSDSTYVADPINIALIDRSKPLLDTLYAGQKIDGYTVYNNSTDTITLKIPPVCLALCRRDTLKRSLALKDEKAWDLNFLWRNKSKGTRFNRLICAQNSTIGNTTFFGTLPPSMSKVRVGILDTNRNTLHGYAIAHAQNNKGALFPLSFENRRDEQAIVEYRLGDLGLLPESYSAGVVNPNTGTYEKCTDSVSVEITLTAEKGPLATRYLAVGTEEYLNQVLQWLSPSVFAFLKAYPNPFNGVLRLQYTLPAGISELRIDLYNVLGRNLYRGIYHRGLKKGKQIFILDTRQGLNGGVLSAGVYILRLSAKDSKGKIIYGGEKRITCIK